MRTSDLVALAFIIVCRIRGYDQRFAN